MPATLPNGGPGTLIKDEKVAPISGLHGTVYRVMYTSQTVDHRPSVVTGLVIVPQTAPPGGGYPVVAWAHGTNGMAPQCAPSLTPEAISSDVSPAENVLLDHGWEIVASDYQGEGTTGPLPYLVGALAAQNTIDIVRAAHGLAPAKASTTYAVWGHSEGGQTAMFVDQLAPTYGPELHPVGVVAGAPPSQFGLIYQFLQTSPYRFYLFMAAVGFNAAYGDQAAPLDEVLTPLGKSLIPDVLKGCFDYLQKNIGSYTLAQLTRADPFTIPAWKALLVENDPGAFTTASPVPLLIPQGGADEQIPPASTQILAQHLCALGQDVQRWIYPGKNHTGTIAPYTPDMVRWLTDRFAGQPSPDPMKPTGQPDVQATSCGGK